ncbi:hypothetical protein DFH08DRAFT_939910 [Mycena albidolilacea]|uniref:CxC2-like cysteine cluster KDZ transposase-associated domain-containing protein n=1 Tax=Mycena albidolilacea TaxID=1033008 RepID=A0AAD6ZQM0_9AGAR|nr:hypothetical protein DFH08DRAFT_939910 [Mycena albidolilacea]
MDAPPASATNSDVLPGSANNPHVLDSPPRRCRKKRQRSDCENLPSLRPGTALDPFTLEDSPHKPGSESEPARPKRIYRGPHSTIVPGPPAAAAGPSREGPAVASAWRGGQSPARAMLALEVTLVAEQREERRAERNQEVTRQYAAGLLMAASNSLEHKRARALLTRSGRSSAVLNTRAARRAEPEGWRAPRGTPLAREDLYLQGTVAPEITALKNHHKYSICHFVKTHPVSLLRNSTDEDRRPTPDAQYESTRSPSRQDDLVADRRVYVADGLTQRDELLNVAHKKRRMDPTDLQDSLAAWVLVLDTEEATEWQDETIPALGKRKQYASTHDPASLWRPLKGFFVDELLRHDSLGDDLANPHCALCSVSLQVGEPNLAGRVFKCYECSQYLQCGSCCWAQHSRTPLHDVQEWGGSFWTTRTLESLGLIYQLGHGGSPCPSPDDKTRKLMVIEAPTIHEIHIRYCKCAKSDDADNLEQLLRNSWYPATVTDPGTCATFRSLEAYRLYSMIGNMNVRDFVTSMEHMTDTTACSGLTWIPDRYKQIQRMARQWAFLKRLKHSRRGHDPAGVDNTKLGECAVSCWACPHDGRNLPEKWWDVHPAYQANEIDDPPLGLGWGYWVEPTKYREHLKNYVHKKDVSTCIAFAALLQKDTRLTTGLRVSGVGGVVCPRHECMRPNGLGDLQKGERRRRETDVMQIRKYGFCCHGRPGGIQSPHADAIVRHCVPVTSESPLADGEAPRRDVSAAGQHEVAGRRMGEGVERTWAVLNPAAYATKDAGRGQRADTLEDRIDNHNWLKNVGQGTALRRKLIVALEEHETQIHAFEIVNETVDREVKKQWKGMIRTWMKDSSAPNPYTLHRKGKSAGQQILAELAGTALLAPDRENKIQEWRHTLLVKITSFRTLQNIYMPGAAVAIKEAEGDRDGDEAPPKPESIDLWMPSGMAADDVNRGCIAGLVNMVVKLRVTQRQNALSTLRSRLHAKRFVIAYRNQNGTGQKRSTKAAVLIHQVGDRVEAVAKRWKMSGWMGMQERQMQRLAKKLVMIGAGRSTRTPRNAPGTSKRKMSWIWTAPVAFDDEEMQLHKSGLSGFVLAIRVRWCEEVMLLREEMRRVLHYLAWQGAWWRAGAALRSDLTGGIVAGVQAYALKQADWHDRLSEFFRTKWDVPVTSVPAEEETMGLDGLFE